VLEQGETLEVLQSRIKSSTGTNSDLNEMILRV